MPTYPDRKQSSHPLQWFALSIAGGFVVGFFVYWVFAALLALSLGAVATAFDRTRQGERVPLWLALPATGVFAFVIGSSLQGFACAPETNFRARIITGATEAVLMMFTGGDLPLEGVARISPWRHVATAWVILTGLVLLIVWWRQRRRNRG